MGSNIIELAKLGHERAAELKASCGTVDVRSLAQLISDLATQLEVQLVRGNAQAVQLANAESKCRELAAENGQMLRLLTNISENHDEYVNQDEYLYAGVPMDYVSEINSYVSRDVDAENPFKETDAYLAEVRASGADAVANQHQRKFDELVPINVFYANEHRAAKEFAEFVATQLRKGAAL
ncbi:hypothetical protein [Citrobacter braakii]|uniref:hypothetical protein n=1 Tax=Citrobacter braakii TaxID=57706 RepID=UPI00403915B9